MDETTITPGQEVVAAPVEAPDAKAAPDAAPDWLKTDAKDFFKAAREKTGSVDKLPAPEKAAPPPASGVVEANKQDGTPPATDEAATKEVNWQTRAQEAETRLAEHSKQQQEEKAKEFDSIQKADLSRRDSTIKAQKGLVGELYSDALEALRDYGDDSTEYAKAHALYTATASSLEINERDFKYIADNYVRANQLKMESGYETFIDGTLKDFGLTVKDLKKIDSKLNLGKPGEVLRTVLTAINEKHTKALAAKDTDHAAALEKERNRANKFRSNFDSTNPGSVADKGASGTGGGGNLAWDPERRASEYFARARANAGK